MKIILIMIMTLTAFAGQSAQPKPPVGVPADAKFFNGKWYRVYSEKLPWNRAAEKCRALGGSLVKVPDEATWVFLKSLCQRAALWIGATDEKTEGIWLWPDGTPVTYAPWWRGQPDNARGIEHYVSTYLGEWNGVPKSGEFVPRQFVVGYICEWAPK